MCREISPTPKEWLQLLPASRAKEIEILTVDVPAGGSCRFQQISKVEQ